MTNIVEESRWAWLHQISQWGGAMLRIRINRLEESRLEASGVLEEEDEDEEDRTEGLQILQEEPDNLTPTLNRSIQLQQQPTVRIPNHHLLTNGFNFRPNLGSIISVPPLPSRTGDALPVPTLCGQRRHPTCTLPAQL